MGETFSAYDKVDRRILCKVMRNCGISRKIVNITNSMYVNIKAKYKLGDIETDWVRSRKGVRHDCILSLLFSFYAEIMILRVKQRELGMRV